MCPLDCAWSDVGSWDEVVKQSNTTSTNKNILPINSHNNFIKTKNRTIATIGIEDTIIIDNNDATLICKKGQSEDVRKIVDKLRKIMDYAGLLPIPPPDTILENRQTTYEYVLEEIPEQWDTFV